MNVLNNQRLCYLSGRRDSNPRPPAPKAGALTGLRYAPCKISAEVTALNRFASAKVTIFM